MNKGVEMTMRDNALCYFVYCWDDDSALLEIIKKKIETQSNERVKVILDRDDFEVSENIDHLEKQILTVDSVVVFFSPKYKEIITRNDVARGVYREYQYIKEKYESNPESIIPVLFMGDIKKSVAEPFNNNITESIADVVLKKNKKGTTTIVSGTKCINKLVDIIISRTENMKRLREPYFDGRDDKIQKLLLTNASEGNLPKECIVNLKVYNELYYQTNSFVVGRKGSGKSTILEVMERRDPKKFANHYKTLYPIQAEQIDMESLYSLLQPKESDKNYFDFGFILKVYWTTSLLLYGIYVVALEEYYGRITDQRRNTFRNAGIIIKKLINTDRLDSKDIKRDILNLCAECIFNYMNDAGLDYVTRDARYSITQVKANFTPNNMLSILLGKNQFQKIADAISMCSKKIVIALDGFDTHSEEFRRQTNNYLRSEKNHELGEQRKEFESLFYRSLIEIIREARTTQGSGPCDKILKRFDYYIVLPKDRYDQIKSIDRDISKYRFLNLQWDAIELITLANLRLEFIYEIKVNEDLDPKSKFEYLVGKAFPALPQEITIDILNQTFHIDLFQYILSKSFWNPRDILAHIGALADAARKADVSRKVLPDNKTIKRIISQTADSIIEKELYKEFGEVFINIREVLSFFKNAPLCMTVQELCDKISNIPFTTNYDYVCENIVQKLRLMYELGIIGCKYSKETAAQLQFGTSICFVFNEGMTPIETILADFSSDEKRCEFVFNPILIEKLFLRDNVLTVIGNYGWEYLTQNHLLKDTIHNV